MLDIFVSIKYSDEKIQKIFITIDIFASTHYRYTLHVILVNKYYVY